MSFKNELNELLNIPRESEEKYKNIRAPESLYERVMASASETETVTPPAETQNRVRMRIMARALASAAVLVLVFTAIFALYGRAPEIALIYEGEEVSCVEIEPPGISTVAYDLRSAPLGIPFTLKAKLNGEVTISVQGGSVNVCGDDGVSIGCADDSVSLAIAADGEEIEYTLYWSFTEESSTLTIKNKNDAVSYVMTDGGDALTVEKK